MISLSNTTSQKLSPGQAITFDKVNMQTGNVEYHYPKSSLVKLKASGIYEVCYGVNVESCQGKECSLALSLGDHILENSTCTFKMSGDCMSVSRIIPVPKYSRYSEYVEYDDISLINSSDETFMVLPNSSLYIKRIA